ncbi:MAG: hypothetical protein FJX47_10505 [Alphaproteobacteria bacterium]|nr:hypothetical protein [Alphaproteobacteria bacterium]
MSDTPNLLDERRRLLTALLGLAAPFQGTALVDESLLTFNRNNSFLRDDDFVAAARAATPAGEQRPAKLVWSQNTIAWALRGAAALPGRLLAFGDQGIAIFARHIEGGRLASRLDHYPSLGELREVKLDALAFAALAPTDPHEVAPALDLVLPRLVSRGLLLIADYGRIDLADRRASLAMACAAAGLPLLELPCGQGLAIKA